MSKQAIANPEDLDRFARELKQYNDFVRESTDRLNQQFRRLGETWRDQEHRKFAEEFERTRSQIVRFLGASDPYVPFVQRKAARLRDYLQQR
jgi:uncharacterized protein YukE